MFSLNTPLPFEGKGGITDLRMVKLPLVVESLLMGNSDEKQGNGLSISQGETES